MKKLQHHRFRFGLIGNMKVLICRIFGHRIKNDPTGFTCQRCRLAYEEIYYPADYWIEKIEWFRKNEAMTKHQFTQIFMTHFDCYTETGDRDDIPAMTVDAAWNFLAPELRESAEQEESEFPCFGDYCTIEQHRFGGENEHYSHKIIGTLKSNAWVDVPVVGLAEEVLHDEVEDVVACVCCGVDERRILRYRISDVKKKKPC